MRYITCLALPLLVAACVGEDAVVTPDAASPVDATADTATSHDSSTTDTSPLLDSSVPDATADAAPLVDAAAEAEAGPPTTTCVDQTIISGSGNHIGCTAKASATSPGGKFAVADYSNGTNFGLPYCPIAYAIGSAHIYVENGETFFRYIVIRKTSAQDIGTPSTGTYWIKSNDGSGPIELVEMCDPQNKGKSRIGTLTISANSYLLDFPSVGQERWTKF